MNYKAPPGARLAKRRRNQITPAIPRPVAGYTRTTGYYGRFGVNASNSGVRPEKKFLDTTLSFTIDATAESASTAGTGQIVIIPQGDTESSRDGRQCAIKSIQIRGALILTSGAGATVSGSTFMWLIQDTQTNGAQAAFSDIFDSTSAWNCLINMENSARFKILKKWVHLWNPTAGATTAYNNHTKQIEFYKRCDIPMEFSSTTGAITEMKTNNVFLVYGSQSIDDLVTFSGRARIRFMG